MTPEEALRHAYSTDLARLPPEHQRAFSVDQLVSDHLAGNPDPNFHGWMQLGSPGYEPQDDYQRQLQEFLLRDYRGQAWTPSQVESLGREPEPYEFSPGGQYADQMAQRNKLYSAMFDPPQEPQTYTTPKGTKYVMSGMDGLSETDPSPTRELDAATMNYESRLGRTHNYVPNSLWAPDGGVEELFNPENSLGTFITKMTPVISDGFSQIGTALQRGHESGETVLDAFGNAAIRSIGADFNRTNPVLSNEPASWREADQTVHQGRKAYMDSTGLSAGDTFRHAFETSLPKSWKGQIPGIQPLVNGAISYANGATDLVGTVASSGLPLAMLKGASRLPGVGRTLLPSVAKSQAIRAQNPGYLRSLLAYQKDELADAGTIAGVAGEFFQPPDKRTREEFLGEGDDQRPGMARQDRDRRMGIRTLEHMNDQIKRPAPYGIEGAVRKAASFVGGRTEGRYKQ